MRMIPNPNTLRKGAIPALAVIGGLALTGKTPGCNGSSMIAGIGGGAIAHEDKKVTGQGMLDDIRPEDDQIIVHATGEAEARLEAGVKTDLPVLKWGNGAYYEATKKWNWVREAGYLQLVLQGGSVSYTETVVNGERIVAANVTINPRPKTEEDATIYSQASTKPVDSDGNANLFAFPTYAEAARRGLGTGQIAEMTFQSSCGEQSKSMLSEGIEKAAGTFLHTKLTLKKEGSTDPEEVRVADRLSKLPVRAFFWMNGKPVSETEIPLQPVRVPKDTELEKILSDDDEKILHEELNLDNNEGRAKACTLNPEALQKIIDSQVQEEVRKGQDPQAGL